MPLGFLGARNVLPIRLIRFPIRRSFDFLRGVDALVWALVYVRAVGLGPLAGVLAIATTDIGIFSKLFAEAIENVDKKQVEGVRAAGGNAVRTVRFGILPQVLPIMLSNVLYMFESNTRSATILGIIGAGGIGFALSDRIRAHQWDEVGFIIIMIIVVVALIDFLSHLLRSRLIKAGGNRPLLLETYRSRAQRRRMRRSRALTQIPRAAVAAADLVAELAIGLVDADRRARARGKSTIGIQRDPLRGEKLHRLSHPRRNRFGGVDLAGRHADAAQADLEIFAQLLEHRHVARAGRGEFHREMVHLQPVQLIDDRIVAALELRFAANAGAARRHRCTASLRVRLPSTTALTMSTAKSAAASGLAYCARTAGSTNRHRCGSSIWMMSAPACADQLQLAPQDRHAVAHEILALRVGLGRFLRIPHPLAEQRRRRQRGLDLARGDALEEGNLLGDEARTASARACRPRWSTAGRPAGCSRAQIRARVRR